MSALPEEPLELRGESVNVSLALPTVLPLRQHTGAQEDTAEHTEYRPTDEEW
jgi:hypothetical protein